MSNRINTTVLMSGVQFFDDAAAINPFMEAGLAIDRTQAAAEHQTIRQNLESIGVTVRQVPAPAGCQDGVYTANWALVRGKKAVLSVLPNARRQEEVYAASVLREQGFEIITVPYGLRFSGQGDALPCANFLLAGHGYRSDADVHAFLADQLGYQVITVQTIPQRSATGEPVINAASGWPDSFFYDIDLAISVLRDDLIAWCPQAFDARSQDVISALPMQKIEVSMKEAMEGFACNLISTGEAVVMSDAAPQLQAAIESYGLQTITPAINELVKGGGYIRCSTLTLSNQ